MHTFYVEEIFRDAKKYGNSPLTIAKELAELFDWHVQFVRDWGEHGKMILSLAEFSEEYK